MSLGRKKRGRQNGDPPNSEKPRGKPRHQRKGRYDGAFTPSEQRKRDQLMKQFTRLEGPSGNSAAYRASPLWCRRCGRMRSQEHDALCMLAESGSWQ